MDTCAFAFDTHAHNHPSTDRHVRGSTYISPTIFGVGSVVDKIDRKGVARMLVSEQRGLQLEMHIKWIVAIPLLHEPLEPRDQSSVFF